MSRAPVLAEQYSGADSKFAAATAELNRRVDQGTSWSGHERNQVFLNLGEPASPESIPDFANVSAVAGFDFPDDSRALVSVDWDQDGDLDFLTSNRTAPRIRIFENLAADGRETNWIQIRLKGKEVNRDAIGSRFEIDLELADGTQTQLSRTVHGGQGFLSQSSRWLHFGIPDGARVVAARAIWGGKQAEPIQGIGAGKWHSIEQGSGSAELQNLPPLSAPEVAEHNRGEEEASSIVVAHLERAIPLPAIAYTDLSGKRHSLPRKLDRPLVLNLWATWCAPCLAELKDFADHAEQLQQAGIDVLGLCVDAPQGDAAALSKARQILEETGFPFPAGTIDDRNLNLLHFAHNSTFLRPSQLPVPTTLLIGTDRRIFSLTRGRIHPTEVLATVAAHNLPEQEWLQFSRPADGIWIHGPDPVYFVSIAKEIVEQGWIEEAVEFLMTHDEALRSEGTKYARMLMLVGTRQLELGQTERGIAMLQSAVEIAPALAVARNNLAVALLGAGRGAEAAVHLRSAIESDPEFIDAKVNLARHYASAQRPAEASELADQVLARGYHPGAIRVRAKVQAARKEHFDLLTTFQTMVENEPGQVSAWANLGKLQAALGDRDSALESFKRAYALAPENTALRDAVDELTRSR